MRMRPFAPRASSAESVYGVGYVSDLTSRVQGSASMSQYQYTCRERCLDPGLT